MVCSSVRYNAEDFFLAKDNQFLATDFDFGARIFSEEDTIVDRHLRSNAVARISGFARTHGFDDPFGGLLLGCVWDVNSTGSLRLALDPLHNDPIG
jgi:hypothetical protein